MVKVIDPVELSQELIKCKSITPINAGAIELLAQKLSGLNFQNNILEFGSDENPDDVKVSNLYSLYRPANLDDKNTQNHKSLCFAGHTDVVPVGDSDKWSSDPFAATIKDGILYGRGAVDMKPAIACFVAAVSEFLADSNNSFAGGNISLLITGDEEGDAVNGTRKVLDWMQENHQKIDDCIIGEPTNPEFIGQMVKIGRRGSINFSLKVQGIQGHVAYPTLADNPITKLTNILSALVDYKFDEGNEYFDPTNLEITNIEVGNKATNVIPETASCQFNVRFNDHYNSEMLVDIISDIASQFSAEYQLDYRVSGESFITKAGDLSNLVTNAIKQVTGHNAILSTTGGTSDARFIKDYCRTIEFGLINKTAHKIDEHVEISDIYLLKDIYKQILCDYFK